LVDPKVNLDNLTSLEEVLSAFISTSLGAMGNVLHAERDELVSCDFQGIYTAQLLAQRYCVELNSKAITIFHDFWDALLMYLS